MRRSVRWRSDAIGLIVVFDDFDVKYWLEMWGTENWKVAIYFGCWVQDDGICVFDKQCN